MSGREHFSGALRNYGAIRTRLVIGDSFKILSTTEKGAQFGIEPSVVLDQTMKLGADAATPGHRTRKSMLERREIPQNMRLVQRLPESRYVA